ncbi:unnamed protein product [Dibothriocephalus latus]|uniref:Uncharacterized protein n=1 Tax=Dibothriocephalus latus TaxID=60516 RepID=A0A3P7NVD3_DIBLA|nr:unnamed protein product [Dibothriocephalus latus]
MMGYHAHITIIFIRLFLLLLLFFLVFHLFLLLQMSEAAAAIADLMSHIKDGVFRLVKGKRKVEEFKHFVETQSYELIEPETWPYSPNAFYMPTVVRVLDLGMSVTKFHKYMVSKGMPAALSLLLVATVILGSGACFGMFLLFICEYCCPPRPQIWSVFGMAGARPEPIVTKETPAF